MAATLNGEVDQGLAAPQNGGARDEAIVEKAKSSDRWVAVPEDAFQAALKIRALVQRKVKMRPDVSIVVAAMILQAAEMPDIVDVVARYGLDLYAKAATTAN
jgi:hypothetical protein